MTGRLELRSDAPDATQAIAATLASQVRAGDVIALSGELGAGKTCFVQGLARALGVEGRVTSPTFVLVRTYEGALRIVHCDVYRLDRLQDVLDLGDEVLAPDAVTLIEWGDAVSAILPDDRLEVVLTLEEDPTASPAGAPAPATGDPVREPDRHLTLVAHGDWEERLPVVAEATRDWRRTPAALDGTA